MLGIDLAAGEYLDRLRRELAKIDLTAVEQFADLIYEAWTQERFVFVFGNGGSGATASHISEDLGKGLLPEGAFDDGSRRRLKALSLTDNTPWIMAVGNDLSYDQIFVQQLMNYGSPGDLVIAISGSGNSPNVVKAVRWANRRGLVTFGMTGFDGGALQRIARHHLHVRLCDMGMVESIHLCLFHWALDEVFARVNAKGRHAALAQGEA